MVKKTRFRKKTRLAENPTWEYVKYMYCAPPIASDHKQIDNQPWHAAGRQGRRLLPRRGVEALRTASSVECVGAMGGVVGGVGSPVTDDGEDK